MYGSWHQASVDRHAQTSVPPMGPGR